MTNKEIFDSEIFKLPKTRLHPNFIKTISEYFSAYSDTINKFSDPINKVVKEHRSFINQICKDLLLCLNTYYSGNIFKAYSIFENTISSLRPFLWIQTKGRKDHFEEFYRIRIGTNQNYTRNDLFHIPFELREKVSSHRYSLSGLPCLYLSNSIYVCWEELGRPDINTIHISRFDIKDAELKFLYLHQKTELISMVCFNEDGTIDMENFDYLMNFIISFPLLISCSVSKMNDNSFVPEYIIPQFLLQWIVNQNEVDGIRYFSNRIIGKTFPIVLGSEANIVIPIKTSADSGYCEKLVSKIKLTNPISWQLIDISNITDIINPEGKSAENNIVGIKTLKPFYIDVLNGFPSLYSKTKFGIMEEILKKMKCEYIEH